MKIDHIDVHNLSYTYPEERRFRYAGGICTGRLTTVVEVHTDTGLVGVGSAYTHPGMAWLTIKQQLEPLLLGEDPRDVEALWERMYKVTRWYGRKGAALTALGALDTAFWDLRAQAAGQPLWQVLGGQKQSCPAYASALLWKEPEQLAAEAASLLEKGFRRMKMRLARSEEYDTAAVKAVRAAIGPDNDLIVDASMRYNPQLAERMGAFFAKNGVFWFEEPFQPEDIDAYTALRGRSGVRVAAGENEFGSQGFRELIRAGAVDIVQPDSSRCGGISEVWNVGQMAAAANLEVATHSWSDAVAIVSNAHAIAAMPNGITVEVDQTGIPFIEELLVEPLSITDGVLNLGDAPGLGIALNRAVLDKYRMPDPLAIPDGSYSDMLFGRDHFTPAGAYQESA